MESIHAPGTAVCLALGVALGLAGCGSDLPDHDLSSNYIYSPPEQAPPGSFAEELQKARVSCENAAECPTNVGLVVIKEITNYGFTETLAQCSGTLVQNDVVLMNSHCVPDAVKHSYGNCGENLGFVLASDPSQRAKCSKVLYASDIDSGEMVADYALMKLERPLTSTPAEISTSGFPDRKRVTIYAVDPLSNSRIEGRLRKKTCFSVQGSALSPKYTHPLADVITLFGNGCHVVHGNSGGGIRDEQNRVIGVVSHGKKSDTIDSPVARLDDFGLGANLACLNLGSIGVASNPDCSNPTVVRPDVLTQLGTPQAGDAVYLPLITSMVELAPKPFHYRVSLAKAAVKPIFPEIQVNNVIIVPECVKPLSMWSDVTLGVRKANVFKKERYFSGAQVEWSLSLILGLDPPYGVSHLSSRKNNIATSSYDMVVEGGRQSSFKLSRTLSTGYKSIDLKMKLKECTAEELKTEFTLARPENEDASSSN